MKRSSTMIRLLMIVTALAPFTAALAQDAKAPPGHRVGIIGLDTSHAPEFTKILNAADAGSDLRGYRVVAAFPGGSPDIELSIKRVPGFTEQVKGMGVEIVDSIDTLLAKVDVVLLESVDGRPHLEQALPVMKAGKPLFIDKPLAGSLGDAVAIFKAAERYKAPVFSSSSNRYVEGAQAIRTGKVGEVRGADAYCVALLEKTHPDLFWYGIHGVESLYTMMGPGCESVVRISLPDTDVVIGTWRGGRVGTFRGIRNATWDYGGTAFGSKAVESIGPDRGGFRPLVVKITELFDTRQSPVAAAETLEIYAFMEAADESKRRGGQRVTLKEAMEKAEKEADARLATLTK